MSVIRTLLILAACTLLMACEPMMFGMPQTQYESLTAQQQQEVIRAYNKRQEIAERNRAVNTLAESLAGAVDTELPRYGTRRTHTTTRTSAPKCHMEGNTQVCKQDSSSSSSSSGFHFGGR